MKTKLTILGSLASLGAAASLNAQAVTAAVGYHTENLVTGFNVVGVNVGNPVAAAGQFDADSATDNDVDFTALLTAGVPYTVQNIATGAIGAVTGFDATTLTTSPALGVTAGDAYEVRQDQTIADLFGAANEAGLQEGTGDTADVIWVPDGNGGYVRIFRNDVNNPDPFNPLTPGWRSIGGGDVDFAGTVIPFNFGVFLERRGADPLSIVFVGHVRGDDPDQLDGHGATMTVVDLAAGFNVVNRIVPVGISAAEAGADTFLTAGTPTTGDVLWNPDGGGGYVRIYNNNVNNPDPFNPLTPGLRTIGGGDVDASGEVLSSGFLIQSLAGGTASIGIPPRLDL